MIIEVTHEMIKLADEINTVPEQNDVDMWNLIIGFVSATFIIPLLQRPSFPKWARSLITVVWSVITGVATVAFAGDLDFTNVLHSVGLVFIAAIATYHGFAGPTGIAPAIENATSPGSARKQPTDDPPAGG